MCGIVGYIGNKPCMELIYNGLAKLEYRGYDSAGIAVMDGGEIGIAKSEGKLAQLKPLLSRLPQQAATGIGHTRWATHGIPSTANAHPHTDRKIAIVHNGIIENYAELKRELQHAGVKFQSETDTEVVLQLLVREYAAVRKPLDAIYRVIGQLRGAFSLGIMFADHPGELYAVKLGSPLVLGFGHGENFFASDAMALVAHTSRACFLEDREVARITATGVQLMNFERQDVPLRTTELDIASASTEKQGFRHFMLKEIHEQPRVISSMIRRFTDLEGGRLKPEAMGLSAIDFSTVRAVSVVACGTAYYAGILGKYFLEPMAGIPVNVELASEFRYRSPLLTPDTLLIAVSQSGETADTLACVKHAKAAGCRVMSICNVKMSSIPRESNATLYMECEPEIGVASTKAFTGMVFSQYLVALYAGHQRGVLKDADIRARLDELRVFPALVEQAVDSRRDVEAVAEKYYEATNFIFMGRGPSFPIALEGALKLKEISYIHAEGYAGGELKHGPIALIDRHMPVVGIAPQDDTFEKMVSNIEEVRARQGRIITLGAAGDERLARISNDRLTSPQIGNAALQTILSVIPLQLLAYYVAVKRGTDVDQPRNLAKSVTVE